MFIENSKYLSTTRVRIMEQELVNGVWKRKLVRHIGTAKSDLDLSLNPPKDSVGADSGLSIRDIQSV